ncbi:PH domain-containing protein [Patescibacteria group bacterium]|nr:PH domain-containing protein [Patescibacteria group bacterium]
MSNNERLIFSTSTHWVKYLSSIFFNNLFAMLGILLLIAAAIASIQIVALITFFVGTILILFAHHRLFHKIMSEAMLDIFVTTDRVIYFDDNLCLCDDEHEIPLEKVAAVEVNQHGLLQNILDYGIIWFDTGGGVQDINRSVPNVPHPDKVSEIIAKVVKERYQRSFLERSTERTLVSNET